MHGLKEFIRGYIACALWLIEEDTNPRELGREDIDRDDMRTIWAECATFYIEWSDLWAPVLGYSDGRAGHDFFLTRNRHGTGFWDRDELTDAVQTALTEAAHTFGEAHLNVWSDTDSEDDTFDVMDYYSEWKPPTL